MTAIYYCIGDPPNAGGHHVIVDHVAALRALGLRAYALYLPRGGEVKRFACSAPVLLMGQHFQTKAGDVVVVPEPWRAVLKYFSDKPCRKIIHCQNPYYIFHAFADIRAIESAGYREMLSCSGYTTEMLRRFGFRHPIHTVRPALAPEFEPATAPKALQIAYMPRKRGNEAVFVIGLFKSLYPEYRDIPWVPIQDTSRAGVAAIMRASAVFAAFGFTEGLGLPPLEAMACGCLVAGFDGLGGADYSRPDNGFWVAEGDYFGFVHQVATAVQASQTPLWRQDLRTHCDQTLAPYSPSRFKAALTQAWQTLLGARYDDYLLDAG